MNIGLRFFGSSLGRKYIMAISGVVLFAFVVAHLIGNLQIFLGPDQINAYGHFLQSQPEILWLARTGLLAMVLLHIWAAVKLSIENRRARTIPYEQNQLVAASYASRTMLMSGLIIAAFIVYHLLHFTVLAKAINLTGHDFAALHDAKGRHDVYRMMVLGFQQPIVSIFYVIAMGLLSLHLSHGAGAMFQSLGLKNRVFGPVIDRAARLAAWLIFFGYISIPLAVLLGLVKTQP
ncbi:MAG: succinate dehydrogenase cytochrome b subunit [Verrucomicrobiota bacterium]|jgi:succinate dehydrogenase / fumarate reductase, cytochrome b subunit